MAKNVIPNLVTKRLSSENFKWGSLGHLRAVGSMFTSALSMPVTERDGNNGTGRQAGTQAGRVRWCGRTLVGCGTGRTGWGVWEFERGVGKGRPFRLQLQQQGGWGSRAGAQAQQELQDQQQAQSETVQPPLNLKVAF